MIYTCSCCKHVEYRDQIACGDYGAGFTVRKDVIKVAEDDSKAV